MLKRLPVFLALVLMLGCAQKPTAYEMAKADYGQVPASYQGLITNKIKESLSDPESAKIEVTKPFPAVRYLGASKGGKYEYGNVVYAWVTSTTNVNQKNPKTPWIFWWSNTGWSTLLPSLEGVTPKYPQQAEEYSGVTFTRY